MNTPITEYEKQQLINAQFEKINIKINNKFSYLMLDDDTKNKLQKQAFNKFLPNLSKISKDNISTEIEKYLSNEYINLLKDLFKKADNKEILINYTNNYFTSNNYNDNIEKLLEVYTDDLLSLYSNISYEECLYLITNNEFLKTFFSKIIYSAEDKPNLFKINKMLQTNLSIFLEPFCQYHNIDTEIISSIQDNYDNLKETSKDNYLTDNILNDYLCSLPSVLSPEEEKRCFLALADGNTEMKNYLIEHNLKFVVSIAKHYQGKGLSLMDLIQEGNIGLIKAVDKFDVTKGFKFVSYARWWIRQSISVAINEKGRTIRLPAYVGLKLRKFEYLKNHITSSLGHDATNKEMAEYIGVSEKKLNDFLLETSDSVSYNIFMGENDESEMQDFLEADINIEEDFIKNDLKNQLIPALKELSFREQFILIERIANKKTLSYVAEKLNITKERVRQIEESALTKLRSKKQIKDIMIYLDNPKNISLPKTKFKLVKTVGSKKDYVLEAINYLTFDEKQYLLDVYGENYENKVELNYSKELDEIILKLKIYTFAIKSPQRVTIINNNLFSYFKNFEKENILQVINSLSDDKKQLLQEKYPNGFDKEPITLSLPYEEYLKRKILRNVSKTLKENKDKGNLVFLKENFEQIKELYLSLNEETRSKLTKNDRVLLDNLFLENKNLNSSLQKAYLIALKNILEISKDSNIDENNKQYLKCIASYIDNQVKK